MNIIERIPKALYYVLFLTSMYLMIHSGSLIQRNHQNYNSLIDSYSELVSIYESDSSAFPFEQEKQEMVDGLKEEIAWRLNEEAYSGIKRDLKYSYGLFILGILGLSWTSPLLSKTRKAHNTI